MKKVKPKLLIAGNATVDLVFKGNVFDKRKKGRRLSLAFGGKYNCSDFYQLYGGGGANASISLAKQGFNTKIWCQIGDDYFGTHILTNFKKGKVKTDLIGYRAHKTPISAILSTKKGERTIVTYRSNAELLKLNNKVLAEMKKRQWLALFSLATCPKKNKLKFLKSAKKNGMKIFLSLHGAEYFKGFRYLKEYFCLADVLQMNAYELADIFGKEAEALNFYKTNFTSRIKVPLLLVTYDKKGSFAYTKNHIFHQRAMAIKKGKVDMTGAGDAWASGFLGKYLKTNNIKKALHFATKNATSVIQKIGAQNGLLKNS